MKFYPPFALLASFTIAGCATAPATQSELMQHYQLGSSALAAKQYDVALHEYRWCWLAGEDNSDFQDFRRRKLADDFAALARAYPPALKTMRSLEKSAHAEANLPRMYTVYSSSEGYLGSAQEARDMDAARNDSNSISANTTAPANPSRRFHPVDDGIALPSRAEQLRRQSAKFDEIALRVALSDAGLQ